MAQNITELGPKEAEFLVRMATSENGIFTAEKARVFWGGSEYTKKTLHRLTNKRVIHRVRPSFLGCHCRMNTFRDHANRGVQQFYAISHFSERVVMNSHCLVDLLVGDEIPTG